VTRPIAMGGLELLPLSDGWFALDGGAMYGVIPKPLWERRTPADARNRIRMGMRPLLVRGDRLLLVDAGVGDKMDGKAADIYGFDRERHLDHALAEAGASAADIEIVLATHLHFDHAGGFTARHGDGRVRPRFPNARYVVRRGEWDDARHPHERNRASYFDENYVPLADAGQLELIDDDVEVMPGVRVRRTGGHTTDHQVVMLQSGGRTAVFLADLVPTTAHVPLPWIMGYDLYPMDTLAFKRAFIREAIDGEYLLFFEHDATIAAGYLRERGGRIAVEPA
jgi:glyoxylase-like metal-dependent hydrolase (beta-lactamase superfamily II)